MNVSHAIIMFSRFDGRSSASELSGGVRLVQIKLLDGVKTVR